MLSNLTSKLKESLNYMKPTEEDEERRHIQYERERFELLRELRSAIQATIELASSEDLDTPRIGSPSMLPDQKQANDQNAKQKEDSCSPSSSPSKTSANKNPYKPVDSRELDERDLVVKEMMAWLERCLWHGMKNEVIVKRGEHIVKVHLSIWNLVRHLPEVCENATEDPFIQTLYQLRDLLFVRTNRGRGRAWLRIALNEKLLDDALARLLKRHDIVSRYYYSFALLRDEETCSLFLAMIAGLSGLGFKFHIDEAHYDSDPEPMRRPATLSSNMSKTFFSASEKQAGGMVSENGMGPIYDAIGMASRALASAAPVSHKPSSISAKSETLSIPSLSFGKSLITLVKQPETCATASMDYRIGVPNFFARCVSLLWVSPSIFSDGLFNDHPPADILKRMINENDKHGFKDIMQKRISALVKTLDSMGGNGLSILSRIGVDVEVGVAAESVTAATRTALVIQSSIVEIASDAFTVAQTLKLFLRQLPNSLIPTEFYDAFTAVVSLPSVDDRIRNLVCLVDTLPFENKATLEVLLLLLHRACHAPDVDGARSSSLAMKIASAMSSSLMWPAPSISSPDIDYPAAVEVIALLIINQRVVMENVRSQLKDFRNDLISKTTRLRLVSEELSRPLDFNDEETKKMLHFLWDNLGSSTDIEDVEFGAKSKGWLSRGFQSTNVLHCFRGGGLTALKYLCYFVNHHRSHAKKMSMHSETRFPFVQGAVHVTRMVTDMLCLSGHEFTDSGVSSERVSKQSWWNLLDEVNSIERIFCMAFLLLDTNFTETHASKSDFFRVIQETRLQMTHLFSLKPHTVDELWHAWIEMRASMPRRKGNIPSNSKPMDAEKEDDGDTIDGDKETKDDIDVLESEPEDHIDRIENGEKDRAESDLEELQQYLPRLLSDSETLSQSHIAKLEGALPTSYQGYNWTLVFSTIKHGENMSRLYQLAKDYQATILVVKDVNAVVFGGFTASKWRIEAEYFGTGESFLFSFKDEFHAYRWTEKNPYFMLANEDSIAMGGGGSFGLFLDEDLKGGTSGHCETYDNPCLASDEDFSCVVIELWSFILK